MKATSSARNLLFLVFFSIEDSITDAWAISSLSATTNHRTTRTLQRRRCRSRIWENPLDKPPGRTRIHAIARTSRSSHVFLHGQGDDNQSMNAEEEEFYREYENKYSSGESNNTESDNQTRKVDLAKAWDEALKDQSIGDSETEGGERISNLSDLQQKLQQIQKRNSEGPLEGYTVDENGFDNAVSVEKENDTLAVDETKQKVAEESLMNNEQYLQILQKAQERLSELTDSDSKIFQQVERKTLVSNMSSLQERLNEIQRDASATETSDEEEQPPAPKYLDDATLAEWEELDKQLKKEASEQAPPASILQDAAEENTLPDEAAILDALRSQAANNRYVSNGDEDTEANNDSNAIYSTVDGDESVDPSSIPSEYKKFVSDYEITEDGGVFLSQEAYLEASNSANPDGSLNFGLGDSDSDSNTSTLQSALLGDEPPMAPYSGSGLDSNREEVSIKDLTEEASRSLAFARNNPEAQEELHRRLMAEFEADEPTNNAFETELLLDPEKAVAFWNQQYMEERKVEVDALEDLLDQKMRELQQEQGETEEETGDSSGKGPLGRKTDSQKQSYKADENIFFASKQERINRKRMIERDRREHAKSIAKFYEDSEKGSSWDRTSESKEVEEINRRQSLEKEDSDSIIEETTADIFEEDATDSTSNDNEEMSVDTNSQEEDEEEWDFDEDPEWVFVEDQESPEDSFYWNEVTSEMRREPPEGFS